MPLIDRTQVPTRFFWYPEITAAEASQLLVQNKAQMIDVKPHLVGSTHKFAVVMGRDIRTSEWFGDLDANGVAARLGSGRRLATLRTYERSGSRRFAGIIVNDPAAAWWWSFDVNEAALTPLLSQRNARLVDLDPYTVGGQRHFAAIMVANTSPGWWMWTYDKTADALGQLLRQHSARLACVRPYDIGGQRLFAAVLVPRELPWWWYFDKTDAELGTLLNDSCAYIADLDVHGPNRRFAAILAPLGQLQEVDRAPLIALTGTGTLSGPPDTLSGNQSGSLHLEIQNVTTEAVQLTRVQTIAASDGGWVSGSDTPVHPVFPTLPASVAATTTAVADVNFTWNHPNAHVVVAVAAQTAGGRRQEALIDIPLVATGFTAPAALDVSLPILMMLMGPIDAVQLTDGTPWITVIGETVNPRREALTISSWSARVLDPAGKVVAEHRDFWGHSYLNGNADLVAAFGAGFSLPAGFTSGQLELRACCLFQGRRGRVTRTAPVQLVTPDTFRSPVAGVWRWSNGPGQNSYHTHNHWALERYGYDLGVYRDVGGTPSSFETSRGVPENFFCWEQPVICMADGIVIRAESGHADTNPTGLDGTTAPAGTGANNVLVRHANGRVTLYSHLRQNSVLVAVNDTVHAGDILARVGNSGTSEPHLHLVYAEVDPNGITRAVPMAFTNLRTSSGVRVTGIPRGGLDYLSP